MKCQRFSFLILSLALFGFSGCERQDVSGLVEVVDSPALAVTCDEVGSVFHILPGETRQVGFTLRNQTDHDILIRLIETSCGCTQASMEDRRLHAGEKSKLLVTLEGAVEGTTNQYIRLEFDGERAGEHFIDFNTTVGIPIITKPERFDLLLAVGIHRLNFEVLSAAGSPIDLLMIDCKCDEIELDPIRKSDESVTICMEINVTPGCELNTVIVIVVDCETGTYLREVPVSVHAGVGSTAALDGLLR
ncbi:MAG: DUF1573 domain-containing protein [Planctomycetaceae bacterium]|nr:DUF1573 domain-containing protein [Planctomycetaceae bacterium]